MVLGTDAVAGFFEDLPVLVIVLSGAMILASTATWVSREVSDARNSEILVDRAQLLASRIMTEIRNGHAEAQVPTIRSLQGLNLSRILEDSEAAVAAVSIQMVYPRAEFVVGLDTKPSDQPRSSGYCSEHFNAMTDKGLAAVLELRVIVC